VLSALHRHPAPCRAQWNVTPFLSPSIPGATGGGRVWTPERGSTSPEFGRGPLSPWKYDGMEPKVRNGMDVSTDLSLVQKEVANWQDVVRRLEKHAQYLADKRTELHELSFTTFVSAAFPTTQKHVAELMRVEAELAVVPVWRARAEQQRRAA